MSFLPLVSTVERAQHGAMRNSRRNHAGIGHTFSRIGAAYRSHLSPDYSGWVGGAPLDRNVSPRYVRLRTDRRDSA